MGMWMGGQRYRDRDRGALVGSDEAPKSAVEGDLLEMTDVLFVSNRGGEIALL